MIHGCCDTDPRRTTTLWAIQYFFVMSKTPVPAVPLECNPRGRLRTGFLVHPAGLEPAIFGFGGRRSNPLNYGCSSAILHTLKREKPRFPFGGPGLRGGVNLRFYSPWLPPVPVVSG